MKHFPTHIVAVDGIIENERGEILLVKDRQKQIYTVPGGQVETGENLIDALEREVMEETGVHIKAVKMICVSSNTCTYRGYNGYGTIPTKVMFGFTCKYTYGELRTSDETSEVLWVKREDVLNYLTTPNLVERFKAFLRGNNGILYLEYVTKPEYALKLSQYL
jgi:ADP-ribose pyrophosphatase YjhB (NUDIX family)